MPPLPSSSIAEAVNIAVTLVGTGLVTFFTARWAARRAIADELTKARNARGFTRRIDWYETARRELRQLGTYGRSLMQANALIGYGGFGGLHSQIYNEHAEAVGRVRELILNASVYATPETVRVLARLSDTLEIMNEHLVVLAGSLPSDFESPEDREAQEREASEAVGAVHAAMTVAVTHILKETRALHGYQAESSDDVFPASAIVDAVLSGPPADEATSEGQSRRRRKRSGRE
jgi:hypothetical protein